VLKDKIVTVGWMFLGLHIEVRKAALKSDRTIPLSQVRDMSLLTEVKKN
jgi:hypothetical protein